MQTEVRLLSLSSRSTPRIISHLYLLLTESPQIVREVCLEAACTEGPRCVDATEKGVRPSGAVRGAAGGHVVDVAEDRELLTLASGAEAMVA